MGAISDSGSAGRKIKSALEKQRVRDFDFWIIKQKQAHEVKNKLIKALSAHKSILLSRDLLESISVI